ncbi:hypothetical protein BTURTLESOX_1751 [bacterium endosymbiont of Bathymodiolus sp. 5 South]|nr:hypothetical protein [uncultured Gammaproteobacteria bacterium]CAC9644127.1 hypothetical protein [uncultured Gammaproteobacteria bacterium]SSC08999.1 hypothetical protein BTURTLESOX_1751 [bacterium endosymbiont of Bathymodiolus sp. 5 South]VVH58564.1 hypothetical protein BSPCLSOX_2277 [uncultured Gammaproteobacteria bacterium]
MFTNKTMPKRIQLPDDFYKHERPLYNPTKKTQSAKITPI